MAACGGDDDSDDTEEAFTEPVRPVLNLQAEDVSVTGQLRTICWPEGSGNLRCEPTFGEIVPIDSLLVARADQILVNVGPAESPDELVVTAYDARGDSLFNLSFVEGETATFPAINLSEGRNILEVTAYYYDLEGADALVSSVFAVDVGTAVASGSELGEGTGTPPSEDETTTPTLEVTEEETETVEATPAPTETPEQATLAPDETDEVEDMDATPSGAGAGDDTETPATDETTPTAEATPTPGPGETMPAGVDEETTTPEDQPTGDDATEEPDDEETPELPPDEPEAATPTIETTRTPMPTTEVPVETATPTLELPTEDIVSPTATATNTRPVPTATNTPSPTVTVEQPASATPTITPMPSVTLVPTADMDDPEGFVGIAPEVTLSVRGRDYGPVGIEYCRRSSPNEQVCVERPADETPRRVIIGRGNAVIAEIEGERPETVVYQVRSVTDLRPLVSENRDGDNNVLFTLNLPSGDYLLSIRVSWPGRNGTYYFRIRIVE
ncbi:MAG: hypothetical protein GYB66_11835 [Chloroflexi bacterium]|nr:hypothetical protein [Chloroflexota bacterium]